MALVLRSGRRAACAVALVLAALAAPAPAGAQGLGPFWGEGVRLRVGDEGEVRLAAWTRPWLRVAELAPESRVEGRPEDVAVTAGLREARVLLFGRPVPLLAFAIGLGVLDLGPSGAAVLAPTDAWADVAVAGDALRIGGGLHGFAGLSRASTVSTLAPLGVEPLALGAPTRGASTDAFDRRLGLFAHGRADGLGWRVAASRVARPPDAAAIDPRAVFVADGGDWMVEGRAAWALRPPAPDVTPYVPGSWLGAERTAELGAGFLVHPEGVASLAPDGRVRRATAWAVAGDLFVDVPLPGSSGLTVYALYVYADLGPDALRFERPLDDATGGLPPGGPGVAAPVVGTGHHAALEVGWLAPGRVGTGRLQPHAKATLALVESTDDALLGAEVGLTFLVLEPHLRLTAAWRLRSVVGTADGADARTDLAHEGLVQLLASL